MCYTYTLKAGSITGDTYVHVYVCMYACMYVHTHQPMCHTYTLQAGSITGDATAIKVYDTRFFVRNIGQSSSRPCPANHPALWCFRGNTITVTFTANHKLTYPSQITLSGLTGSQTPSTSDDVRVDAFTSGSPYTRLSAAIVDAVATTINVVNATAGSITLGSVIRIDEEMMLVTNVSSDESTLEVVRGEETTVAAAHESRSVVVTVLPVREEPVVAGIVVSSASLSEVVLDAAASATDQRYAMCAYCHCHNN